MKFRLFSPVAASSIVMVLSSAAPLSAAVKTWIGGTGSWATGSQWGGTAPIGGDSLIFAGSAGTATNNTTAGTSYAGITFASGAGAFTVAGTSWGQNGITLTGDILNSSSVNQTFDMPIILSGTRTFDSGANGITLQTTDGNYVSGSGGLIKTGSGTLTIGTTSTYTGVTNINEGTLLLGGIGRGNLSNSTAVTIASGAAFSVGIYPSKAGSIAGAGNVVSTGAGNLTVGANNSSTLFSGNVAFTSLGTLTKEGTGTLVFSGTNSNVTTQVNAGTVVFQKNTSKGSGTATATAAGSIGLGVGGGAGYTEANVASLFNTNNLTGFTLATGANSATSSGVALDTTNGSFDQTTALTATRALTKLGSNTLTLSGSNSYSGITTVSAGTLAITGNQTTAGGDITVASGARLQGTGTTGADLTTISSGGTLAAGLKLENSGGTVSDLAFASGSIFEWDINNAGSASLTDVEGTVTGSGAKFKILLNNTTGTFWNTNHTWSLASIFAPTNGVTLQSIFGTLDTNFNAVGGGRGFSYNNLGELSWSAVPEPTSALAGILLGAGLLRRKRNQRLSA